MPVGVDVVESKAGFLVCTKLGFQSLLSAACAPMAARISQLQALARSLRKCPLASTRSGRLSGGRAGLPSTEYQV